MSYLLQRILLLAINILQLIMIATNRIQGWEIGIAFNIFILLCQLTLMILVQKGVCKANHGFVLVALGLFVIAVEQDFSSPIVLLIVCMETREAVFPTISLIDQNRQNNQNIDGNLFSILGLAVSELYMLVNVSTRLHIEKKEIIYFSILVIIRIISLFLPVFKSKDDHVLIQQKEDDIQVQIPTTLRGEKRLQSQDLKPSLDKDEIIEDKFQDYKYKNIISNTNRQILLKDVSSYSSLGTEITPYQRLLDILPEGLILIQNTKKINQDIPDSKFHITYVNQMALKLLNASNKKEIKQQLFEKREFENIIELPENYHSATYNSLSNRIIEMQANSKAYFTKKTVPTSFIRIEPKSNFKQINSQKAIHRMQSPSIKDQQFVESDSNYLEKQSQSLGDEIKKIWTTHCLQNQSKLTESGNLELRVRYLTKIPQMSQNSGTVMKKSLDVITEKTKVKKKSIEISIYSSVIEGKLMVIILFRDVTYRSQIDLLHTENRNKSKTISYVSHEFRTPLSCMIQMLESYLESPSNNEVYVKSSLLNAQYLLSLSNDLLDLAQIKIGKFQINNEVFSLKELINECIEMFQVLAIKKNISLFPTYSAKVPDMIMSDPRRVKQIIINLIGNAFKFTIEGQITIQITNPDPQLITVKVTDTGIGIREQDKAKLFQAFGKLEGSQAKLNNAQGVGLGLFISNQIAKLIGANPEVGLGFDSEFQKGTTFSFQILDLKQGFDAEGVNESYVVEVLNARNSQSSSSSQFEDFSPGQLTIWYDQRNKFRQNIDNMHKFALNPKLLLEQNRDVSFEPSIFLTSPQLICNCSDILIIDDNQFNIEVLRMILAKCNKTNVDSTISGLLAEEMVKSRLENQNCKNKQCRIYKLIFFDLEMPMQDGRTTMIHIDSLYKQINSRNQSYFIACTGYNSTKEKAKCLDAGANDYLVKPVSKKDIQEILDKFQL